MKSRTGLLTLVTTIHLFVVAALPIKLPAAPLTFSELSLYITSGEYGTTQTTETVTATALLGYSPYDRFYFELSAPYIYSSGKSQVLAGSTTVKRRETGMAAQSDTSTSTDSQNGPGDVICAAYLDMITESEHRPMFTLYVKIKFPTADDEKGLGTGETDFITGVQLSKGLGLWNLFAEGAYVFQGENDQLLLKDFATWKTGIGYLFSTDLLGEVFVWGATEPAGETGSLNELHLKMTKWNDIATGFSLEATTGLNDQSLNYGLGASFFVTF